MKNFLSKTAGLFKAFRVTCSKHQMPIQSVILWIVALTSMGTDRFWLFAIPAIIVGGIGDIIIELRKLNTK